MLIAQWVVAVTGLVTAVANVAVTFRHGRNDEARFTEHAEQIKELKNGKAP